MDLLNFIATLAGIAGSLCTVAGFVLKVVKGRRNHRSSRDDDQNDV